MVWLQGEAVIAAAHGRVSRGGPVGAHLDERERGAEPRKGRARRGREGREISLGTALCLSSAANYKRAHVLTRTSTDTMIHTKEINAIREGDGQKKVSY